MNISEFREKWEYRIGHGVPELFYDAHSLKDLYFQMGREQGALDKEFNYPNRFRRRLKEMLQEMEGEIESSTLAEEKVNKARYDQIEEILEVFEEIMKEEGKNETR